MDEKAKAGNAVVETLLDPVKGPSYEAKDAPWCTAFSWSRTWFDWHDVGLNLQLCDARDATG